LVLLSGFGLSLIDFFVVNVALPTMGRDLHTGSAELELVVSGYGLAYAVGLVLGGRLGDAYGRRRLFSCGMVAFTVTSAACGLAPTIGVLIVARVAQGLAASLMVPQVLATIQATTEGVGRARAISLYGATAGVSMVAGQLVGGALLAINIAGTGWRPVFLVNVPIGAVALVATRRVPPTRAVVAPGIDRRGTLYLALAQACLLVFLSEGEARGWPWWVWAVLAGAPLFAWRLLVTEARVERQGRLPLLPPAIIGLRSMRRGLGAALPFFAGFGSFMFVYALAVQEGLGLGPLAAGGVAVPLAASFFVASLIMPRAVARYGRRVVTFGAGTQGVGLSALAVLLGTQWPRPNLAVAAVVLAVTGFGQGLVAPPLFRVVLSEVPAEAAGTGSGVLVTTQQTALALGAALGGTLFLSLTSSVGFAWACVAVLGAQTLAAVVVAVVSLGLPDVV
jgi:MFS family permease